MAGAALQLIRCHVTSNVSQTLSFALLSIIVVYIVAIV